MSSVDFEFSRQSTYKNKSSADAARETNNKCQIKWIQLIFIKDIFLTSFTKIMGNLFGKEKKSPSRINDQDRAVLVRNSIKKRKNMWNWRIIPKHLSLTFFQELKKQRDQLHKYQKRIELSLEKDRTLAKKLLSEGKKEWVIDLCESFLNN